MSRALKELRPAAEVLTVEPDALDSEVERVAPGMVLCSCLTTIVENRVPTWVEVYPGGRLEANIGVNGLRLTTFEGIELSDLLWIADRAESLARENGTSRARRRSNRRHGNRSRPR